MSAKQYAMQRRFANGTTIDSVAFVFLYCKRIDSYSGALLPPHSDPISVDTTWRSHSSTTVPNHRPVLRSKVTNACSHTHAHRLPLMICWHTTNTLMRRVLHSYMTDWKAKERRDAALLDNGADLPVRCVLFGWLAFDDC